MGKGFHISRYFLYSNSTTERSILMKRLLFILAIVVLSLAILAPLTGAFVVGSGLLALAVVVAGLAEGI